MAWLNISSLAGIAAILFALFGLAFIFIARHVDKWPMRMGIAILSFVIILSAVELAESAAFFYREPLPVCRALFLADTLLTPILHLLVTAYFLHCCGEDWRRSRVMLILYAMTGLSLAVELFHLLTGAIRVTPDYAVEGAPWPAFYLVMTFAMPAVGLIALLRRRKKLSRMQGLIFIISFLTPAYTQSVLVALLLLSDLVRRYQEQKEEAARQRTRIAVLQMRPHFIYNTLISIYYLCARDPQKAQQVIRDFSRYLQSNFNAIVEEGTIPFEKELEHTSAYLAVEQARFEGQLSVAFDTPFTAFRLPPLTLQPIVENAVKHGLDPNFEPLHISIVTEYTETGVRITVEDTGPGYDPAEDCEPHATLENIRQRLRSMCGGTLQITPREAGGTRVTIYILDQAAKGP